MQKKVYKSLDILKFICSIMIACFYHYRNDFAGAFPFQNVPFIKQISLYGWMLVELFFIISGFLFFTHYFERIKNKKLKFQTFITNRYIRLIPVAAVTTIVMFFLQQIYMKVTGGFWLWGNNDIYNLLLQISGLQFWFSIAGASLNNVVWYISVLLFCYILYYYVSVLASKYKKKILFLVPILGALLINSYQLNLPFFNWFMIRGIISFGIGITLGMVVKNTKDMKRLGIMSCGTLCIVFLFAVIFRNALLGDVLSTLNFIIYPCLILVFICGDKLLDFLSEDVTKYLGSISFGIYLWNLPIQIATELLNIVFHMHFQYSSIWFLISQIIIHVIVAILSHHFLEERLTGFAKTKIKKIEKYLCS